MREYTPEKQVVRSGVETPPEPQKGVCIRMRWDVFVMFCCLQQ